MSEWAITPDGELLLDNRNGFVYVLESNEDGVITFEIRNRDWLKNG